MGSHAAVVKAFGGQAKLAAAIGISSKRALHFPRRGIPSKYWLKVEDAARALDIPVTARDLEQWPVADPVGSAE